MFQFRYPPTTATNRQERSNQQKMSQNSLFDDINQNNNDKVDHRNNWTQESKNNNNSPIRLNKKKANNIQSQTEISSSGGITPPQKRTPKPENSRSYKNMKPTTKQAKQVNKITNYFPSNKEIKTSRNNTNWIEPDPLLTKMDGSKSDKVGPRNEKDGTKRNNDKNLKEKKTKLKSNVELQYQEELFRPDVPSSNSMPNKKKPEKRNPFAFETTKQISDKHSTKDFNSESEDSQENKKKKNNNHDNKNTRKHRNAVIESDSDSDVGRNIKHKETFESQLNKMENSSKVAKHRSKKDDIFADENDLNNENRHFKTKENTLKKNFDSILSDDEALPETPMKRPSRNRILKVPESNSVKNVPPELASIFNNLQKYKKGMNGISNENHDILTKVAAKKTKKESKLCKERQKEIEEIEANSIMSRAANPVGFSHEFTKLQKTISGYVDHDEYSKMLDLFKGKLKSILRSSVLDKLSTKTAEEISLYLLQAVHKEEENFQLYLYLILVYKLKLTIFPTDLYSGNFLSGRFIHFCRSYSGKMKPLSLLTCLNFCLQQAVRKSKSVDELRQSFAHLVPMLDEVLGLLARRKKKDFDDFQAVGLIMFSLFGYFSLVNSADINEEQYLISVEHFSIGKLFERILKFSKYELDFAFRHFANVLYNYSSGQSIEDALNLWLDLIKVLPFCLHKYNWHILYMAMKQIGDEGQYDDYEEKSIAVQLDVLDMLAQITPHFNLPSKDQNFSEVNHVVYMIYFVLKTYPTEQSPKELLELIKHVNLIKPERISNKNRMMLVQMELVANYQVEQGILLTKPDPDQEQQPET